MMVFAGHHVYILVIAMLLSTLGSPKKEPFFIFVMITSIMDLPQPHDLLMLNTVQLQYSIGHCIMDSLQQHTLHKVCWLQ